MNCIFVDSDTKAHRAPQPIYSHRVDSPLGQLLLLADSEAMRGICLPGGQPPQSPEPQAEPRLTPLLGEAAAQLQAYFAGRLQKFALPLAPAGTDFQRRVWQALCGIEYGQTVSYKQLAERVGCVCARAVGQANSRNPLPIVIPCHRVVAANGGLGGFAGGLEAKIFLLRLEEVIL